MSLLLHDNLRQSIIRNKTLNTHTYPLSQTDEMSTSFSSSSSSLPSSSILPFIVIEGPNILPDDIFRLSFEGNSRQDLIPQIAEPAALIRGKHGSRNSNEEDGNGDGDLNDPERVDLSAVLYDVDNMREEDKNRDIAPDEFDALLSGLLNTYIEPLRNMDDIKLRNYIYKLWDLEEVRAQGIVELRDVHKGYEKNLSNVLKIFMLFLRHHMVGKDGGDIMGQNMYNQQIFNRVLKSIFYMNNILVSEYHIRINLSEESLMNQEDSINLFRFTPQDYSKNNPFQNLLIYLLNRAYTKGYRLYREACYRQIYHNGYPTHAWKYVMPVTAFVYDSINKDTQFEMWQNLTNAKDNAKRAAEYLLNCQDKEFPRLEPDRHLFSWTDGIYDAKKMTFYAYDTDPLPSNRVAIKFFEQPFNPHELFSKNWYDIETPELQGIFNYQGLDESVSRTVYAMMGKCFYEVGEMDRWEVIMFIKGVAGSGKSTIGKFLKEIYPATDIAILSSNIEKKFGLQPIFDKLLWLCFEVKGNWGLDQGDFQCMISGEEIPVAMKHKTAVTTLWKTPGMLMGNEVARSWLDAAGSMTRRILVLEFLKKVKQADTTLGSKIRERLAATIHKCNMAYRTLVDYCGSAGIWDKLPDYFKTTRQKLASTINPLEDFLNNSGAIRMDTEDEECFMPLDDFKIMYLDFCKRGNHGRIRFNPDHYASVFESYGIVVQEVKGEKSYHGEIKSDMKWVIGIDIKQDETLCNNA